MMYLVIYHLYIFYVLDILHVSAKLVADPAEFARGLQELKKCFGV